MTLQEENEKLRGLLTTLRVSLNLDDTEYGLSKQEKRKLAADIDAELSRRPEPAPAQDERELPLPDITTRHGYPAYSVELVSRLLANRSEQTEQKPVVVPEGWLIELGFDVLDRTFRFVESKSHTPTIKVILPPCEPDDSSAWDLRDEIAQRIGAALAPQTEQQPEQEPFWYAVVSEQAPSINSAIKRLDVAQEFADSKRERWPDTRVVPLYTAPQPEQSGLPEELFDGYAVYQETVRHRRDGGLLVRTSSENVSDTLDAVVRLIKARRDAQEK